jgi:hypothetical protein
MTDTQTATTWTITGTQIHANGYSNVTERTTATYQGDRGEFFSGIKPGTEVTVERVTYFDPTGRVTSEHLAASRGGAWWAIYEPKHLGL